MATYSHELISAEFQGQGTFRNEPLGGGIQHWGDRLKKNDETINNLDS